MDKPGSHLEALDGGRQTRRLTTILVADICGYSRMSERDEEAAIRTADLLYKLFEDITEKHGGRVFKRIADGFLAEYPSARSGMQAALDYTKEVKARNNLAPNAISAQVRAGIHVGDVTDRPDGDILGHGVNVAARLQELADPGTILASSNIMNLTRKDIPFKINKRTGLTLKNISEPMTAFQIDPEKSGGGFDIQIPKIFKSKALLYTALAGVVLYGAMTVQGQRAEAAWEERVKVIIEKIEDESSGKSSVSEPYIRNVLENLHRSNIPSHQASFALLEEGNIGRAISNLERSLEETNSIEPNRTETMHVIAALSYYTNTRKSRTFYELLFLENPEDKAALLWLVRSNILLGDPENAIRIISEVVDTQNLSPREKIRLQMDMAFSLMYKGEFQAGADILQNLKQRIDELGDQKLILKWHVDLAQAYERLDKLNEAEKLLLFVTDTLEREGTTTQLPRAYNVLGLIWEKRAAKYPSREQDYLSTALDFYEKQYSAGLEIDKKHELSESLHYQGRIRLHFGNDKEAYNNFSKSFRISDEEGHRGPEFKARLGLAQVEHFRGNQDAACKHIRGAERHFEKHMGPNLGPTSRKILKEIGCGFKPAPDL